MAENKDQKFHYGGQAVIEGVMMRGPKDFAVAVRRTNGEIVTTKEDVDSMIGRFKWLDKPFLRGTLALIDSMALGIKALKYSADIAMADIDEADKKSKPSDPSAEAVQPAKPSKVNDMTVGFVMVLGIVLGLAMFMLVPIFIVKPLTKGLLSWQATGIEGAVKIALFVGYVLAISMMKDIRRVFQYHGAEHKTINAYEAREELTVENVSRYPKAHLRCGTSFILVVIVASIIVFMLVADHLPYGSLVNRSALSYPLRFLYKIALLPLIAGIAYEVIRYAGRHKDSLLAHMLVYPGLLMQKITTREPEPQMIEVAIKSLESVLEQEASHKESAEPAAG